MSETVVIYARVGNPMKLHDEQIDICEKFSSENDLEIIKIYQDTCSGNNKILLERFNEILKDVTSLAVQTLLVSDMSRISRNDLILYEIQRKFKKYNKSIVAVN